MTPHPLYFLHLCFAISGTSWGIAVCDTENENNLIIQKNDILQILDDKTVRNLVKIKSLRTGQTGFIQPNYKTVCKYLVKACLQVHEHFASKLFIQIQSHVDW